MNDPTIAHLEAVVALGERMAHDARGLIAARKQAAGGLSGVYVDAGSGAIGRAVGPASIPVVGPDHLTPTPDPTPPLPGAVQVDPTERDGEMVPTWKVKGSPELESLQEWRGWECVPEGWQHNGDDWGAWDASDDSALYLVRRKAGA